MPCSRCGKSSQGFSYCYSCSEHEKKKRFALHGVKHCARCNTRIPGDRKYCWSCYRKVNHIKP